MPVPNALSRRLVLLGLASALMGGASTVAYADNGDGGDGSDGGDGNEGGDDGNGGQGTGSANTGTAPNGTSDQNRAQDAVKTGAAMPLAKAFDLLNLRYPG